MKVEMKMARNRVINIHIYIYIFYIISLIEDNAEGEAQIENAQ